MNFRRHGAILILLLTLTLDVCFANESLENLAYAFLRHEGAITKIAFEFLFAKNCQMRFPYFDMKYSRSEFNDKCERASSVLYDLLDLEGQEFPVVFKNRLLTLSTDPRVVDYLKDLNFKLLKIYVGAEPSLSLMNFTLHYTSSREEAMEWMAVIFQGTGFNSIHIEWLKEQKKKDPKARIFFEIIDQVLNSLSMVKSISASDMPFLFSDEINSSLLTSQSLFKFYRFFVPSYLSQMLIQRNVPKDLSIMVANDVNWIYELISYNKQMDLNFSGVNFSPNSYATSDILTGFMGALYGANEILDADVLFNLRKRVNTLAYFGLHDFFKIINSLKD